MGYRLLDCINRRDLWRAEASRREYKNLQRIDSSPQAVDLSRFVGMMTVKQARFHLSRIRPDENGV
ncbi:hypothetical protein KCP74_21230 [Salmonella enterica subsp. enterica]|nr:hypothetical protein KCP74_21230 [Salmonella enterica subsp. enterica]